jgi:hypothetical protein
MGVAHEAPSLFVLPTPTCAISLNVGVGLPKMIRYAVVFFTNLRAAKDDASIRWRHSGRVYAWPRRATVSSAN